MLADDAWLAAGVPVHLKGVDEVEVRRTENLCFVHGVAAMLKPH